MADPSNACNITAFSITVDGTAYSGTIDNSEGLVSVRVPKGTDLTALTPTITVSENATIDPASGTEEDFSDSVSYTVTAEDTTTTKTYTVVVIPDIGSASGLYKPRVPGWSAVRVISGDIDSYSQGGIDIGLGNFVPRFAISVMVDGPFTGFYDVGAKKLKIFDSSGEASSVPVDTKYVVVLMGM